MGTIYIWNAKCSVDGQYYKAYTESSTKPNVCPNNSSHSVDSDNTFLIRVVTTDSARLTDANEDNRIIVSPGLFPDYMTPQFNSCSDDFENGLRNVGARMVYSHAHGSSAVNDHEIRFIDYSQILGGYLRVYGANSDDYFHVKIVAPNTPITPNLTGTGNCTLVDLGLGGGASIIVPVPGFGNYNVDLTTPYNANLAGPTPAFVSRAVPVNAYADDNTPIGFWDWDRESGAVIPMYNQDGRYNLYNFPITLVNYANRMAVFSGSECFFQNMVIGHRGGSFLPQWKLVYTTTRASSHDPSDPAVIYTLILLMARKRTN